MIDSGFVSAPCVDVIPGDVIMWWQSFCQWGLLIFVFIQLIANLRDDLKKQDALGVLASIIISAIWFVLIAGAGVLPF